jgi:hypothetical protein
MSKIKSGFHPAIQKLYDYVENNKIGEFLSWEKLEEICGIDVRIDSTIISGVRSKLLSERNNHIPSKFLSNIKSKGYEITLPNNFSNQAIKWKRKSKNACKKSYKILNAGMTYFSELQVSDQNKLLSEKNKVACLTIVFKAIEDKKILEQTNNQPKLTDSSVIRYLLSRSI